MTDPVDPAQMTGTASNGFEQMMQQAPQAQPAPPAPAAQQPAPAQGEKTFGQEYVHQLREEAKENRLKFEQAIADTEAKAQQAAQDAADRAKKELTESLGKALGLVSDDTPPDPELLITQARQAQAEAERLRTEADQRTQAAIDAAKAKTIEADLYRRASVAGADPTALLDSRSFMDRADVKALDPAAADYATQMDALIKGAVDSDARYRAQRITVPRSGGDLSAGNGDPTSGAADRPLTVEERIAAKLRSGGREGRIHTRFQGGRSHGESINGGMLPE